MAIVVISQSPPGGRCTLYARYADAISEVLGWSHQVVHSECRDAHGEGFPSLRIRDAAIQPSDGAILAPEDICAFLAAELDAERLVILTARLETVLETFLAESA